MLSSGVTYFKSVVLAGYSVRGLAKMPKSKKQTASSKQKAGASNEVVQAQDKAVYENAKKEIVIKVHAKPGAKESLITDITDGVVGVQIGAAAVDGEANKELVRYLAEVLNLKKSEITLDKGSRSREKTVLVDSSASSAETILSKLLESSKQR